MSNLPQWPDYRPFQKSKLVWSATSHCFNLWLWKIYKWKLQSVLFLYLLTKFQSNAQKESYDDFPQVTCFECNSGACKKANFLRSYLRKYRAKSSEIRTQCSAPILLKWVFFCDFWNVTKKKKVIAKMPWWLVWSSETLESKALIPNVMKPAQEKIDQRLIIQPFRGETSFTLHKWTILGWFKWQNLLSIYRSMRSHNITQPT